MADPWASEPDAGAVPVTMNRTSPEEGGFWGFWGNAWNDVKDFGRGIGALVGTVVHDTWNAARQSVIRLPWTDPEEIAAKQAAAGPGGAFILDDMAKAVTGIGPQESVIAKLYTDYYGPGANEEGEKGVLGGNFDPLYEHPLQFISDALTVATAGGFGAAKAGQVASKAGLASTSTGRVAQLARSIQGSATRVFNPLTGKVETVGAAFNPTRRILYQNRYLGATSRSTPWLEARADKMARLAEAAGTESPRALTFAARANEYRTMFEHAQRLGADRVLKQTFARAKLRKYIDHAVGAAVGSSHAVPELVERSFDENFGDLNPELVSPDDLNLVLRGLDTDLTADHIVAPVGKGVRRTEVFDPAGVRTETFGDRPVVWGEAFDPPDATPPEPYVLPLKNVKDTPEQRAAIVTRQQEVFDAGSDPQYAYHFSPQGRLESIKETGLDPARPADANIDPTAETGVYFGSNAKDAYQALPMKSARDAALLRVRRDAGSFSAPEEASTRFQLRKDGSGWRVRDTEKGVDHSARIPDKARAQSQADTMNARLTGLQSTKGIQGTYFGELIASGRIDPSDIEYLGADGRWQPLVPEQAPVMDSSGFDSVDKAVARAAATRTDRGLPADDENFDSIASHLDDPESPLHARFLSLMDDPNTKSLQDGVFSHTDPDTGITSYWSTQNGTQVDGYLEMTPDGHATAVAATSKQGKGIGKKLMLKRWDAEGIDSEEAIVAEVLRQSVSTAGARLYLAAAAERLGAIEKWREVATESVKVRTPKLRKAFEADATVTHDVKGARSWARKAELMGARRAVTDGERYRIIHEGAFDPKAQQGLVNRVQRATGDIVRKVENQVDAPGVDGSRELRIILEAADDQHPYEVSILTPYAAKVMDATANTRAMYNALTVAARRGMSQEAADLKYLEALQHQMWEGVTDELRMARGGPAPADMRARANRFRVDNYGATTDRLLGRGLSPRSAFENAYLSLRYGSGAKKDAKLGHMTGGPSPLELDDAIARSGEMAPLYFPFMAADDIPRRGEWLLRRGGPTTGKGRKLDDPNLKRNTGELLQTGRFSKDNRTVYTIRAAQAARLQENVDMLFDAVAETGRPLRHPEDFNPNTEELFAPGLVKRLADQHNMLLDELANDTSGRGLGDLMDKLSVDNAALVRELLESGGDIEVWAVPKAAAQRLRQHSKWMLHEDVDALFGSTTRLWRALVLSASPRWVINNLLGNTVMGGLEGVKMTDVLRLTNKKFYDQVLEAMGEDARRGVTGSLHSSMSRQPKNYGDQTVITNLVTWLQQHVGGTRVVKRIQRIGESVQNFNSALEDRFRVAGYLSAADKRMMRQQGASFWKNFQSSKRRLEHAFQVGLDEKTWRATVDDVNRTFNDYHTATPLARNVIKPYLAPFWSFYKHAAKTILRMPFDHPAKANALALMSLIEDERERTAGIHPEDMPGWMRGTSLFIGNSEAGDARFLSTAGSNPFNTVLDTPLDILHPAGKMLYEQSTGRSSFTGRKFTDPKVVESFGTEQQYRIQEGAEPQPIERVAPHLFEHLLQQIPQYEMVKDLLAGGTTYDTSDLIDVLKYRLAGGEDPVPRTEEGDPISSRTLIQTLGKLFGYTEYDKDMAALHERRLEEKAAALEEYAKRQGVSSSEAPSTAANDPWGAP